MLFKKFLLWLYKLSTENPKQNKVQWSLWRTSQPGGWPACAWGGRPPRRTSSRRSSTRSRRTPRSYQTRQGCQHGQVGRESSVLFCWYVIMFCFSVRNVRPDPASGCWSNWLVCLATSCEEKSKTCKTDRYRWASNIGRHGGGLGADWGGVEGVLILKIIRIFNNISLFRALSKSILASCSTNSSTTSTPRPSPWPSSRRWSCPPWTWAVSPILMSRWRCRLLGLNVLGNVVALKASCSTNL